MALRSLRILRLQVLSVLLFTGFSLHAQTYRLYLTQLSESPPTLELIDSTGDPASELAFHPRASQLFYLKKQNDGYSIVAFDMDSGKRDVILTGAKPLRMLRPTPDGKSITFIDPSTSGELRKLSLESGNVTTIPGRFSFQNYLWIDDNNLLAVEPGEPNALKLFSLRPSRQIPVARHVGRTLTGVPKMTSFAFVHKLAVDSWSIKKIGADGTISILAETLPEADIFFINDHGEPVVFYEGKLHRYNGKTREWSPVNLRLPGKVTAIQSKPDGQKVALWVEINP